MGHRIHLSDQVYRKLTDYNRLFFLFVCGNFFLCIDSIKSALESYSLNITIGG